MMVEQEHLVEALGPLADLDLLPGGGWVGLVGPPEREPGRQWVVAFSTGETVEVPGNLRCPVIRATSPEEVVVVGRRRHADVATEARNAWIVRRSGDVSANFDAGDGIEDVVVTREGIVVTYFDEGVFGREPLGREGLVLFDLDGALRWGYHSRFEKDGRVFIADCYVASATETGNVLFLPRTEFPLVRLDVANETQEVYATPEALHGAHAISMSADDLFAFDPRGHDFEFLRWVVGTEEIESVGTYTRLDENAVVRRDAVNLRGLPKGRFLSVRENGYTLLAF